MIVAWRCLRKTRNPSLPGYEVNKVGMFHENYISAIGDYITVPGRLDSSFVVITVINQEPKKIEGYGKFKV